MDFVSIRDYVCAKVSKNDDNSKSICFSFVKARDKMIYESADWKAAQIPVDKTIPMGTSVTSVDVPEVHHVLSVRLDGKLLDPISTSYAFENTTAIQDLYADVGTPIYYDEFLNPVTQTRNVRFFPQLDVSDGNHSMSVLGKAPYSDDWTAPAIPQTENALIAMVLGDMWEYLHQVGKAQAKFTEGQTLIEAAKSADTPSAQRPRMSRTMTADGNSLGEMIDAVSDIIGDWSPSTRESIRDRIRRNYRVGWDGFLFPETTVVASVQAVGNIATFPHLFDKIISVRTNVTTPDKVMTIPYTDACLWFGIQPDVFDNTGVPLGYSLLLPVGLPPGLDAESTVMFTLGAAETATVTIRGEFRGVEMFENVVVTNAGVTSTKEFDTIFSIWKPVTQSELTISDPSGNPIIVLEPTEQTRKYPRIQVYPGFDPASDPTVFALAKRRIPQLLDDGDTPQLTGIENTLISGAASDMFLKMGKADMAATYKAKADANYASMIDRATKQQTYAPRVLPYIEPDAYYWDTDVL